MIDKPFSQACENNKKPILEIIRSIWIAPTTVWEIGSGSGQHACYFAQHLPYLEWQPTEKKERIPGICLWQEEVQLVNLKEPLTLDVTDSIWPCQNIEALFTANTLHIMSWSEVKIFFQHLSLKLSPQAMVCIYGPFNYNGSYISDSNRSFDERLRSQNPLSGIRNFEDIMLLASTSGLQIINDFAMPANNRLLVLQFKEQIGVNVKPKDSALSLSN